MDGFFLVDKEKGKTSFDVVRDVRRKTGERRVGHGGTLDPLATGLLVVGVGKATKKLKYLLGSDKEYFVTAKFGFVSDSYDADGKVEKISEKEVSKEELEKEMSCFKGEILQCPPKYSALKVGGKRAADIMRSGGDVKLEARKIIIMEFEIVEYDWPFVSFRVACGSGTYVRSLIHDLGQKLGVGAYVVELRRTKVADFRVEDESDKLLPLEAVKEK